MDMNDLQNRVHKARPADPNDEWGSTHCAVCMWRIHQVPGGSGTTWVHTETGTVAAPGGDNLAPAPHHPMRGDDVEVWITQWRDQLNVDGGMSERNAWHLLDSLLDDYRLHADTGTPLNEEVQEH